MRTHRRSSVPVVALVALLGLAAGAARAGDERFRGPERATRMDVAEVATRLLALAGQLPAGAVPRRVQLVDVRPPADLAAATAVHRDLLQPVEDRFEPDRGLTRLHLARVARGLSRQLFLPALTLEQPAVPADVPLDLVTRDVVLEVLASGYMDLEGGAFLPDRLASRYELALVTARLARRFGLQARRAPARFLDVPGGHPARDAVLYGWAAGLTGPPLERPHAAAAVGATVPTTAVELPPGARQAPRTDLARALHELEREHSYLLFRLGVIRDRLARGDRAAPEDLHGFDEDWTGLQKRFTSLLLQERTRVTDAERERLQRYAEALEQSRWVLRGLYGRALQRR